MFEKKSSLCQLDPLQLYKPQEVASLLGISRSLLYDLIKTGELPSVRIRSAVRVRLKDILAFIEMNSTSSSNQHGIHSFSKAIEEIGRQDSDD